MLTGLSPTFFLPKCQFKSFGLFSDAGFVFLLLIYNSLCLLVIEHVLSVRATELYTLRMKYFSDCVLYFNKKLKCEVKRRKLSGYRALRGQRPAR